MSEFNGFNPDEFNNSFNQGPYNSNGQPAAPGPKNKGLAVASLCLGIASIIPGCCLSIFGILLAIVAIVLAIVFFKTNKDVEVSKGMAVAGVVLGIIGLLLNVGLIILNIIILLNPDLFDWVYEYADMYSR